MAGNDSGTYDSGIAPSRQSPNSGDPPQLAAADPSLNAGSNAIKTVGPGARCRGCGYRLRGLSVDAVCPECGRSVEASLRGDQLIHADANYLKDLTRGIVIIEIALALATLAFVWWLFGLFIPSGERAWYSFARNSATSVVMFIGLWMFTKPDPGLRLSDPGDRPRRIVRLTSLIVCIAGIGAGVIGQLSPANVKSGSLLGGAIRGRFDLGEVIPSAIAFVGTIASIVQFFASMLYVQWLARRMPSKRHFKWAGTYMWLLPIIYVTQVLKPIAFILYFILMDDLRVTLQQIRNAQQQPTPAPVGAAATPPPSATDSGAPNQQSP